MLTKREGKPSAEEMSEKIKKILEQTLAYPRPEELEELKKLIQRNIPLGRRTYFAAYLLLKSSMERPAEGRRFSDRQSAGRPAPRRSGAEGPAERRGERAERSDDRPSRKPEHKSVGGVNFYINVGFHDHMNPRALASFIAESCKIKPEDVCDINLKPAYAFFTVRTELAGGIPEGLNGKIVGKKTVKANPADQRPPRQQRPRQDSAFRGQPETSADAAARPQPQSQPQPKPQARPGSAQTLARPAEPGQGVPPKEMAAEPQAMATPQTMSALQTAPEPQPSGAMAAEANKALEPQGGETQTAPEAQPTALVPQSGTETGAESKEKPEVPPEER